MAESMLFVACMECKGTHGSESIWNCGTAGETDGGKHPRVRKGKGHPHAQLSFSVLVWTAESSSRN